MKYIYYTLLLLTGNLTYSQTPPNIEWGVVNNNPNYYNIPVKKIPNTDNYIARTNGELSLTIFDSLQNTLSSVATPSGFTFNDIEPTDDGGYIALGRRTNNASGFPSQTSFGGRDAV